jgi:hypothetical protein
MVWWVGGDGRGFSATQTSFFLSVGSRYLSMDVFGTAVPVTGRYLKLIASFGGKSLPVTRSVIDWSTDS